MTCWIGTNECWVKIWVNHSIHPISTFNLFLFVLGAIHIWNCVKTEKFNSLPPYYHEKSPFFLYLSLRSSQLRSSQLRSSQLHFLHAIMPSNLWTASYVIKILLSFIISFQVNIKFIVTNYYYWNVWRPLNELLSNWSCSIEDYYLR